MRHIFTLLFIALFACLMGAMWDDDYHLWLRLAFSIGSGIICLIYIVAANERPGLGPKAEADVSGHSPLTTHDSPPDA